MDEDYLLAIQLQEQFDYEASQTTQSDDGDGFGQSNKKRKLEYGNLAVIPYTHPPVHPERPMSIVDESWETLDPSPDARAMFLEFNDMFFWGKLSGVEVKWSPRMTLCAGVCSYEGRGGLCSIRLSEPLLKLRPRRDLVQTLLHEMIHALLFVTQNNRDRDGHGPEFCKHMHRINDATGTKITVYHTFHDEVDLYRQHWWRCNGPCQSRKPYFGYVKRATNRAPAAVDNWWGHHQSTCGGTYTKVKEPEGYRKKGKAQRDGGKDKMNAAKKPAAKAGTPGTTTGSGSQDIRNIIPFSGKGFLLGGSSQSSSSSSSGPPIRPPDHSHMPPPVFPVSPPKPVLSPLGQTTKTVSSPGWPGGSSLVKGSSSSTTRPTTGGAHVIPPGPRAPTKKSVSNTSVFTNINGSPVRIPKQNSQSTKPTDIFKTKQNSVYDLFNARGLKTSQSTASSSTVSKPPAETKSGTTSLSAGSSNSFRQPRNTTSTTSANNTTGVTAASSSQSKPLSNPGALSGIGSKPSSAKPHLPHPSGDPASQPGLSSSRKRPWENRTSAHIFDFFQRTLQEASATSSTSSREDRAAPAAAPASSSSPAAQPSAGASAGLMVSCPVCQAKLQEAMINEHLDSCLSG